MRSIDSMQKYVARASVSTSALRAGRNAKRGIKKALTDYLFAERVLTRFSNPRTFARELDALTNEFVSLVPRGHLPWGRARKLANIYLRDASYNYYLREKFGLGKVEELLEVPVDSLVNAWLRDMAEKENLPKWKGVIGITPKDNEAYQAVAAKIAKRLGHARHVIDVEAWGARNS